MKQRYSKRDIAKMQRIYKQTMSMTATAAACGCSRGTIKKYRDEQKWVTPKQIKALANKYKNDTTLTPDIAIRLAKGWNVKFEDTVLCDIIGITYNQLTCWLRNNQEVTLVVNVKKPDGTEERRVETIGLKQLRAREWAKLSYNLMNNQLVLAQEAKDNNDQATAARIEQWILEKIEPKKYGQQPANVTTQVQINQISVDELPIEMRKQILAQIRAKKEITKEIDNG